ncbi:hypothetical protein EGM88_12705 [Aureibaculum marinum]|uniref:Uncharacterized protein n=1 Tax=Aureibaculum marinum TaxID=2487930 RepID=A0A3N4NH22_9FLAO|nr:hypothetical protein [Aureibaculum marinum]RPD94038.1 hypothetical protein EGM88_12705 [Aureibaculum marinum]
MKRIFIFLFSIIFLNHAYSQNLDTLFIKFDDKNIIQKYNSKENYVYYLLKNSGNNGQFYFKKNNKSDVIKPKNVFSITDILRNNKFYSGKNNLIKLDDWELWEYFEDIKVFMVKNNDCIYKLESYYVIE